MFLNKVEGKLVVGGMRIGRNCDFTENLWNAGVRNLEVYYRLEIGYFPSGENVGSFSGGV